MNRSAKIRRVIQVIAIMLALTLSFPQIPLAQKLGLGYEEVHAEPGEGFEIGEGGIINNIGSEKSGIYLETYIRGNNLIITPEYEVSEEELHIIIDSLIILQENQMEILLNLRF